MNINYIKVSKEEEKYKYNFSPKANLVFSNENSKGKTTLLRFILYGLGYQVPATEGIGDFDKYNFELSISRSGKEYIIYRKSNEINLNFDNISATYTLPIQETELHSLLFGINETSVLKNLLAVYYIDQEKGWTMLNRGKIIGNIRFNIEEFIAGISNIDITSLLDEKKAISAELKKYRYFKNVVDINSEYEDAEDSDTYKRQGLDELLQTQKELQLKLNKIIKKRKSINSIISENKNFSQLLIDLGIVITHNGEEIVITEEKLSDFRSNQAMLKIRENNYKIEEERIKSDLKKITSAINEKNTLFSLESIVDEMEKSVESWGGNIEQIDKIIRQLSNKRNKTNEQIKQKLSFNNGQLNEFYDTVNMYAIELGIKEYISNDSPQFILTNKLKGFSGRVLAQMSYIFKLSYIKTIKNKYNLNLPIIIDSPRTNELSEKSTDDMLKILARDFSDHQIILASIYENNIMDYKVLSINDGLFSDDYKC